jgi:hypothetical protein
VDDADARGAGAQRPRRRRRREGAAHPCLILRSGSRSGSGVSGGSGQLDLASGIGDAEEATRDGGGREGGEGEGGGRPARGSGRFYSETRLAAGEGGRSFKSESGGVGVPVVSSRGRGAWGPVARVDDAWGRDG